MAERRCNSTPRRRSCGQRLGMIKPMLSLIYSEVKDNPCYSPEEKRELTFTEVILESKPMSKFLINLYAIRTIQTKQNNIYYKQIEVTKLIETYSVKFISTGNISYFPSKLVDNTGLISLMEMEEIESITPIK